MNVISKDWLQLLFDMKNEKTHLKKQFLSHDSLKKILVSNIT
jgi:hypothetical protein